MAAFAKPLENILTAFERLSRREKFMVAGAAGMFVLFIGFLVSMWVSSSLTQLRRQIESKTASLQEFIDLREQYEQAKQQQKLAQDRMRQGKSIQLLGTIDSIKSQLGVNIEDMQPRSPTIDADAKRKEDKVDVHIKQITIDRLVDLLEKIESKAETLVVRKLRVKQSFQQPDQLEVNFTVSNFQLIEEQPDKAASKPTPTKKK
jgi:hypothetical protein